jgi:RND family efflux transporter MFP subunit
MSGCLWPVACLSLALALPACGRKKQVELPPSQGPNAAPMPVLPAVPKDSPAPPGAESANVAPTEGRTTGTTLPRAEAQVGPKGQGLIEKVFVKEGDRVRRGMVLFRQDARDAELRVAQAKAQLESARVGLKAVEVEHARTKQLFDKSAVSAMQWDQIQAQTDAARANVQQAQVMLDIAEKALADTVIRSPIDGVVTAKLKSEGEMVTMMPPTVVVVVQDQSVLDLRFRLPESALRELKVGQPITVRFDALDVSREAKVSRINPAVDARTRTVEVIASIPNKDNTLKSGLLAQVKMGQMGQSQTGQTGGTPAQAGNPRAAR